MKTMVRVLAKSLYGVTATLFLAAGASVLLVNSGLLPAGFRDALINESRGNLTMLHVLQEFGSVLVFVGLITFWFVRHYEQSQAFHWSMTILLALLALVHWIDVRGPSPSVNGPLATTVPFLVFVVIGLLRTLTEGLRGRERAGGFAQE